jgi:hypothetical protein
MSAPQTGGQGIDVEAARRAAYWTAGGHGLPPPTVPATAVPPANPTVPATVVPPANPTVSTTAVPQASTSAQGLPYPPAFLEPLIEWSKSVHRSCSVTTSYVTQHFERLAALEQQGTRQQSEITQLKAEVARLTGLLQQRTSVRPRPAARPSFHQPSPPVRQLLPGIGRGRPVGSDTIAPLVVYRRWRQPHCRYCRKRHSPDSACSQEARVRRPVRERLGGGPSSA